jgi:hypothetical protein
MFALSICFFEIAVLATVTGIAEFDKVSKLAAAW